MGPILFDAPERFSYILPEKLAYALARVCSRRWLSMKWLSALVLLVAFATVGCSRQTGYILTSYRSSPTGGATITLRHGQQIKAECASCNEYGALVGQELSCFVEPFPVDPKHPFETRGPIFNAFGGTFVCHAGKGRVFMVRHYSCTKPVTQ